MSEEGVSNSSSDDQAGDSAYSRSGVRMSDSAEEVYMRNGRAEVATDKRLIMRRSNGWVTVK